MEITFDMIMIRSLYIIANVAHFDLKIKQLLAIAMRYEYKAYKWLLIIKLSTKRW